MPRDIPHIPLGRLECSTDPRSCSSSRVRSWEIPAGDSLFNPTPFCADLHHLGRFFGADSPSSRALSTLGIFSGYFKALESEVEVSPLPWSCSADGFQHGHCGFFFTCTATSNTPIGFPSFLGGVRNPTDPFCEPRTTVASTFGSFYFTFSGNSGQKSWPVCSLEAQTHCWSR